MIKIKLESNFLTRTHYTYCKVLILVAFQFLYRFFKFFLLIFKACHGLAPAYLTVMLVKYEGLYEQLKV